MNPNFNQVNLRGACDLSKRTELYIQGSWQHVSSNGKSGTEVNGFSSAQYTGDLAQNQVVVTTGIRHRF